MSHWSSPESTFQTIQIRFSREIQAAKEKKNVFGCVNLFSPLRNSPSKSKFIQVKLNIFHRDEKMKSVRFKGRNRFWATISHHKMSTEMNWRPENLNWWAAMKFYCFRFLDFSRRMKYFSVVQRDPIFYRENSPQLIELSFLFFSVPKISTYSQLIDFCNLI